MDAIGQELDSMQFLPARTCLCGYRSGEHYVQDSMMTE